MAETVLERFSPAEMAAQLSIPGDKRRKGRLFTPENARENWLKSREAMKANQEAVKQATGKALANPQTPELDPALTLIADELRRVSTCLADKKLTVKERCDLNATFVRLLDCRRVLLGQPLPGSSRPKEEKPTSAAVSMLGQSVTSSDSRPGREDQD